MDPDEDRAPPRVGPRRPYVQVEAILTHLADSEGEHWRHHRNVLRRGRGESRRLADVPPRLRRLGWAEPKRAERGSRERDAAENDKVVLLASPKLSEARLDDRFHGFPSS